LIPSTPTQPVPDPYIDTQGKDADMLNLYEIKKEIEQLPKEQFDDLRQWLVQKDWYNWERQIINDSKKGKLNFLIEEAMDEKDKGQLQGL